MSKPFLPQVYEFDGAISFAREDERIARRLSRSLNDLGLTAFVDFDYTADFAGRHLDEFLEEIYSQKARFCLPLLSSHYRQTDWTRFEQQILRRRTESDPDFLIPIKIDDTTFHVGFSDRLWVDWDDAQPESTVKVVAKRMVKALKNDVQTIRKRIAPIESELAEILTILESTGYPKEKRKDLVRSLRSLPEEFAQSREAADYLQAYRRQFLDSIEDLKEEVLSAGGDYEQFKAEASKLLNWMSDRLTKGYFFSYQENLTPNLKSFHRQWLRMLKQHLLLSSSNLSVQAKDMIHFCLDEQESNI